MKKLLLLALLLSPSPTLACWQIHGGEVELRSNRIRARLTFDHKPIRNAPIELFDISGNLLRTGSTDRNGWIIFNDLPHARYKFTMSRPSGENIYVDLLPPTTTKSYFTMNFYADWCRTVKAYWEDTGILVSHTPRPANAYPPFHPLSPLRPSIGPLISPRPPAPPAKKPVSPVFLFPCITTRYRLYHLCPF